MPPINELEKAGKRDGIRIIDELICDFLLYRSVLSWPMMGKRIGHEFCHKAEVKRDLILKREICTRCGQIDDAKLTYFNFTTFWLAEWNLPRKLESFSTSLDIIYHRTNHVQKVLNKQLQKCSKNTVQGHRAQDHQAEQVIGYMGHQVEIKKKSFRLNS